MPEYGLTSEGPNIKRLDVLLDEMHDDLTEEWGVNTRTNPQSFINVLLTDVADKLAELWEMALNVYNSQNPLTAEGMYLDGVGQFTGVTRTTALPSYYYILCTGTDGTELPQTTVISSATAPVTYLRPAKTSVITREAFNKVYISIVAVDGNPLTIALNGEVYAATPDKGTNVMTALEMLATAIYDKDFTVSIDQENETLNIEAISETSSNTLVLSENLTTAAVGSIIQFATEETGDIYLPEGAITEITKAVTGLTSVVNVSHYIAGNEDETDTEYRQSYQDKIFLRSSRMIDSIQAAIISNVQGVSAVAVYENDTDFEDEWGRYPHSVEVVCQGGDDEEIAEQILNTKAGGINTFGDVEVEVTTLYDDAVTIRFNRPTYVRLWVHVEVSIAEGSILPTNYADTIREIIVDKVGSLGCGDDVFPQNLFIPEIYAQVAGVGYVEITMGTGDEEPSTYDLKNLYCTVRELAQTSAEQIEVIISG